MFEITNEENEVATDGARIKVIGVGGGGCNAVNTMIKAGLSGVEYVVANTDAQALKASLAPTKVQLGSELTKGLGAGANPEVGRKAALDDYEKLSEIVEGADMVFITAGMGGGTGTGAAPVIAKLAKELGALTVGVVTKPFIFEGKKRFRQATEGIHVLEENVDSLITIPNQRLLYIAGESLSLVDTFKKADEVLLNAVRGISDLINNTGHINADFADVKTVMINKGLALMGTGMCQGPDRAIKAANEAISSPLLEDITVDGATGIIINITGNESLTMHETNEAVTLIMEAADEEAEIIFGTVIDDSLEDNIKVTVIATGLGGQEKFLTKNQASNQRPTVREQAEEVSMEREREQVATEPRRQNVEAPIERTQSQRSFAEEQSFREQAPVERVQQPEAYQEEHVEDDLRFGDEVREEKVERESSLLKSIRSAASRYENSKSVNETEREKVAPRSSAKARSIAEKLGFINFDEEELDTPTFLRKDEGQPTREDKPRQLDI